MKTIANSPPFWLLIALSLLSGTLLSYAFAPKSYLTFALLCPAVLLWTLLQTEPKQAWLIGGIFGFSFFATEVSWVYLSIHYFGGAAIPLALLITSLFLLLLAVYPAILAYTFRKAFLQQPPLMLNLLIFPALWTITEILRSTLLSGFPWALLGYTYTDTALSGFAPLCGVYGISFLATFCSGALVSVCAKKTPFSTRLILVFLLGLLFLSGKILQQINWTRPLPSKALSITALQGNISQKTKWANHAWLPALEKYIHLTQHGPKKTQLFLWPEAALATFPEQADQNLYQIYNWTKHHKKTWIFGAPLYEPLEHKVYNGVFMMGSNSGIYKKRHLVPFGEYTPLPHLLKPLSNMLNIPMSNFTPGPQKQAAFVLTSPGIRLAPFLCYEIAFSTLVLNSAKNSVILINLSDDSWFNHSPALQQHLQIAQMRALETGRPLMTSTNTGITACISSKGTLLKALAPYTSNALTCTLLPRTGSTPLMRYGYLPLYTLLALLLLAADFSLRIKKNK